MTIEQALRELSGLNATISFRSIGDVTSMSIACRGHRVAWFYDPMANGQCNLSVLSWKIVMLTRALKRRIFVANVSKRLEELFDLKNSAEQGARPATLLDLAQFAKIVDDELDRLETHRQPQVEDGRKLVEEWGQTETKEA